MVLIVYGINNFVSQWNVASPCGGVKRTSGYITETTTRQSLHIQQLYH